MTDKYLYYYGLEEAQDVAEARQHIVSAFDQLIEEMLQYMLRSEQISGEFETDEYQAFSQHWWEDFVAKISNEFPEYKFDETLTDDPEVAKQHAREKNAAEMGGQEKRLTELSRLRNIFAKIKPEKVTQKDVHRAYRIFKAQVMRSAMDLSNVFVGNDPEKIPRLVKYTEALRACGSTNESWDFKDEVYPFEDVKF